MCFVIQECRLSPSKGLDLANKNLWPLIGALLCNNGDKLALLDLSSCRFPFIETALCVISGQVDRHSFLVICCAPIVRSLYCLYEYLSADAKETLKVSVQSLSKSNNI